MYNWGVVAAGLFGLLVCPFVIVAMHQLFATRDRTVARDRSVVDPPSTHETYRNRRIPGSNGLGSGEEDDLRSR
ncbi:hypothetical protein [Salinarchaeum laminariae]|uniref:hypothetical protein n=1 Tax=Salinarchaeum laminariae TaxID=869888 RepID=UPI0020C0467E|nr:hypothetical protein [Salinarchaeum laminariae]